MSRERSRSVSVVPAVEHALAERPLSHSLAVAEVLLKRKTAE